MERKTCKQIAEELNELKSTIRYRAKVCGIIPDENYTFDQYQVLEITHFKSRLKRIKQTFKALVHINKGYWIVESKINNQ